MSFYVLLHFSFHFSAKMLRNLLELEGVPADLQGVGVALPFRSPKWKMSQHIKLRISLCVSLELRSVTKTLLWTWHLTS